MIFDPFENLDIFNSIDNLTQQDSDGTTGEHFVQPHLVSDYVTDDGTFVDSYWRDGDGDTSHNLDTAHGGGYFAHDPT